MGERESDYDSIREARISENQARMETLGLRRAAQELNEMAAAAAPARRPWTHRQYATGPPRRSPRLNGQSVQHKALPLKGCLGKVTAVAVEEAKEEEKGMQQEEEQEQAAVVGEEQAALDDSDNEGMGAVYDDAVSGSSVQPAGGQNGASTRIERVVTDT